MTSLAGEDEMNTLTPCVMGDWGKREKWEEGVAGVCRPWVPGPLTKSAVSVTRASDSSND